MKKFNVVAFSEQSAAAAEAHEDAAYTGKPSAVAVAAAAAAAAAPLVGSTSVPPVRWSKTMVDDSVWQGASS